MRGCVTANHPTISYANSAGVICSPKHVGCEGDFDKGLFSVSLNMVQFTDTFDSSMYIHMNRTRHKATKANTPSSNRRCLAAINTRMKFDMGSKKSRVYKNRTSTKKRLKQSMSLLNIIPTLTHPGSNVKDDFYHMLMVVMSTIHEFIPLPQSSNQMQYSPSEMGIYRSLIPICLFQTKVLSSDLEIKQVTLSKSQEEKHKSIFKPNMMILLHCAMPLMKLKRK